MSRSGRNLNLEDYMRRCKKDWTHEEQGELMRSLKTLHELKESWKNTIHAEEVDKSDDENPSVPTRDMSRATEVGEENGRRRDVHALVGEPRAREDRRTKDDGKFWILGSVGQK